MIMKNFALIGAAGYIAKRHVEAIKKTGNNLITCIDKFDQVGFLDNCFPNANFHCDLNNFGKDINLFLKNNIEVNYLTICTPNYLHKTHINFGLTSGIDVICEKPIVLNPIDIDKLIKLEKQTGKKINCIQQLRLHPAIVELKNKIDKSDKTKKYDVELNYISSRGNWYANSWKSDIEKSGGVATNIGIHFFDMLVNLFGNVQQNIVYSLLENKASGFIEFENARVKWFLSTDFNDVPLKQKLNNQRMFRSIKINDEEIDFTLGFEDLHTKSYVEILNGNGFSIESTRKSVEIVYDIRNSK